MINEVDIFLFALEMPEILLHSHGQSRGVS